MKFVGAVFSSIILVALLSIWMGLPAWAQVVTPTGCTKFVWSANTESDLAGYNLYLTQDTVVLPPSPVPIASDQTEKLCSELPQIVQGHLYGWSLTAFDTSGNESPQALGPDFIWPDSTPPDPPSGGCVQYRDANDELQCAVTP